MNRFYRLVLVVFISVACSRLPELQPVSDSFEGTHFPVQRL